VVDLKIHQYLIHWKCRPQNQVFSDISFIVILAFRIQLNYVAIRAVTPFEVIQGHRVWYKSKAHMQLPISD